MGLALVVAAAALVGTPLLQSADAATGKGCSPPPRADYPDTDGARDATARSPLFRRAEVPGFTDQRINTASIGLEDFNGDGRHDIFVIYNDGTMRMLLGDGCMGFRPHAFEIVGSAYTEENPPGAAGIANFADFNDDGHLDVFVSHNAAGSNPTQGGASPSFGNSLLLSRGRWDRFREAGPQLGITNETAYNRASSIADVDGDGHLDIAVGADQIGTPAFGGGSTQRLYVWREKRGRFTDIGGTRAIRGFGGELACDPSRDEASPGILLRDLDGDLRPDLVQGYHNDMLLAKQAPDACVTGERDFGLFAWRNRSAPRRPSLAPVGRRHSGLGGLGRMRYDYERGDYDTVSHGLGLPYVFAADAFNSGRLDLIAVGPTDPEWHVNTDMIAGKFFRNRGDLRFADRTRKAGLSPLNWTGDAWGRFYEAPLHPSGGIMQAACATSNRKPTCSRLSNGQHQAYPSTISWGDVDNDGCLDFVFADRHEDPANVDGLRNGLFRNRCDGTFEPARTQWSGLDTNSISVELADLNGDGLLDLVAGEQPTNSYPLASPPLTEDRYYDKVYFNTGAHGSRRNHYLEVDLTGAPQRRLIGAQLRLTALRGKRGRFLGRRDYVTSDSYKSARWPLVHWGLGSMRRARLDVTLPSGRRLRIGELPCVDARLRFNVRSRTVRGCNAS